MYTYRTSGHIRPPTFGRHGAHKHHDSMDDVSVKSTISFFIKTICLLILFTDNKKYERFFFPAAQSQQ